MTEIEASPRRAFLRNVGMLGTAVLLPTGTHPTSESETRTAPSTVPVIQRTSASLNRDVVETTFGKIRGYTSNGIHTFKGVPYGIPTDGASRFRSPAKPKPWSGVRDTLIWGYVSPQRVQDKVDQNLASFIFEPRAGVHKFRQKSAAAAGKWETMLFNDLCVMRNDPDGAAYELVRSIPAS